ncbi:hypothetical protein GF373_02075 [bacterium]|nr:hypothetical protein [bacterium]
MYPVPGHLALGLAGAKLTRSPLIPVMLGTFLPDIIDKVLADVIPIAPYGRCWAHTLVVLFLISGIFYYFKGKSWGIGWGVGHFLHLLGDISFIPWFYPFINYTWPDSVNVTQATATAIAEMPSVVGKYASSLVGAATDTVSYATTSVPEPATGFMDGFAPIVSKVFVPHLMGVELLMLLCSAALLYWTDQYKKLIAPVTITLLITYLWRISYVKPEWFQWFS